MSEELRKALEVGTSGTGQYIVAEDLEPLIREELFKLSPLSALIANVPATQRVHEYRRRTASIEAWVEGELTSPSYSQSTYERRTVALKQLRAHGKVSDFMQASFRDEGDALALEIASAVRGMAKTMEFMTLWGCAGDAPSGFTGDSYQYTGALGWLLNDAGTTNFVDADGVITLTDLDDALNLTRNLYQGLQGNRYVWVMSPGMRAKVSGLQARVTREIASIEYDGQFTMTAYDRAGILPSGFVKPASTSTSPSDLAAAAGGDGTGSLSDGTYYYYVSSVTIYGEQIAGTVASVTLSGGTSTQNVDLSWTADSNAKLYMIYRGTSTGHDNCSLIDIIAAKTYDSTGAVSGTVATYDDTTAASPTYTSVHPLASGEENIFLLNLTPDYGIARPVLTPTLGEPVDSLVHYVRQPVSDDSHAFSLKSYHALQVPDGKVLAMIRRAKTA